MGCLLIGAGIFASMLYGSSCAQLVYYLWHYWNRDRLPTRLLDTIVTASDIGLLWSFLITNHGCPSGLLILEYATTVVTTCAVQMFYISQIWQYSNVVAPAVLSLLPVETVYSVATMSDWILSESMTDAIPWTSSRVLTDVVADVYICVALSWTLHKRKTGIKKTDNIISKLTTYTINRGILSMLVQIVLCGTYVGFTKQSALIWMIPHCAGCKIYVNSMMAVLNARHHVKKHLGLT
ncbi:uncharacterized protein B0H18DRAFT_984122 [Fomitopsis serialis]|uniref:uncharacterized protein n=1 Tax=Fomitopsis serialis TaxID=139415 RepID=UPI002007ABBC|nr:uncharacterized protein B0H18DRAFT_984122 [Neoantrodia serialis]KAH9933507.1 hypothetical protein B0H18DRAFT_984122 [Neoantrodia serialis]